MVSLTDIHSLTDFQRNAKAYLTSDQAFGSARDSHGER